ncbi:MFS transporter [Micromonospora sp. LOL_021]|uniref:MFS transporter n=1 Tax=Micromonospora sp. LOL_021 TaxID=3345417 RepID=UPI003A8867BF
MKVRPLLAHPPFRRRFLAQALSMTGTTMSSVALAFGVLETTGSASALAVVMASYSLSMFVLMPVGGVWADRLPRDRLMMSTDLVRFLMQTIFGVLLLAGEAPLWTMVMLQVVSGAAQAFSLPATIGLTAATAPAGMKQQANALNALTRDVAFIVGPIVAGTLTVTVGAGWALLIDGLTYLGSALLLLGLRLPPVERKQEPFLRELREGWIEVSKRSWVWASVCYFALFNLVFAIFTVLGPARLADRDNGALEWAAINAGLAVGTLCGNALALRLAPRYLLRWARVQELLVVPMIVVLALDAPTPALVACALLMGVSMSFPDALWYTALQQEIPDKALSRVSSFDYFGSFALRPLGYLLAAVFVSVGATGSLLVIAGVFAAATLATLAAPGVRNLERRPEPSDSAAAAPGDPRDSSPSRDADAAVDVSK